MAEHSWIPKSRLEFVVPVARSLFLCIECQESRGWWDPELAGRQWAAWGWHQHQHWSSRARLKVSQRALSHHWAAS